MRLRKLFEEKACCEEILSLIGDIRKDTSTYVTKFPIKIIQETDTFSLIFEIITEFYLTFEEMAYQGMWLLCNLAGIGYCADLMLD